MNRRGALRNDRSQTSSPSPMTSKSSEPRYAETRADPHLRHDLEQTGLEGRPVVLLRHDRIDVDDALPRPRLGPGRWRDRGSPPKRRQRSASPGRAESRGSPETTIIEALIREPPLRSAGDGWLRRPGPSGSGRCRRPTPGRRGRSMAPPADRLAASSVIPSMAARHPCWPLRSTGQVAAIQYEKKLGSELRTIDDSSASERIGLTTRRCGRCESVLEQHRRPPTHVGAQGHDQLLADRVHRRIGDLGEQLVEELSETPWLVGQGGQRGVVAHRAGRRCCPPPCRPGRAGAPRGCTRTPGTTGRRRSDRRQMASKGCWTWKVSVSDPILVRGLAEPAIP